MVHEVERLFEGAEYRTSVWISKAALKRFSKFSDTKDNPKRVLLKKLKHYAVSGFENFEGGPIQQEGDGVYRIGRRGSLYRLIGFYEDSMRSSFIIMDAFLKSGQKLSAQERDRINEVARIKKNRLWKKKK